MQGIITIEMSNKMYFLGDCKYLPHNKFYSLIYSFYNLNDVDQLIEIMIW